ncbi:flagellar basal body rod protein FlgB [Petroclostridium sp. X23]|uniref:flagellar basal body rod protein FlgB n=1 Tax=Petroclostridium sp. X23 TaxID=3045146 RepID=UPI0024ACAEA5|nr:flagellar basal body rod protein FlgB [Petroclostridium sp. X23]WHH60135.1 flagellar basal body rod protein FlgB [Petroclostridium sp. X23]
MINKLFDSKVVMHKALDAAWLRNDAIAENLANVDTPGYKRIGVAFEEYLSKAVESGALTGTKTHEKHITIGSSNKDDVNAKVSKDYKLNSMRIDGNNVDIDKEMADLAKNSIWYNALIKQAGYGSLRAVVNETK